MTNFGGNYVILTNGYAILLCVSNMHGILSCMVTLLPFVRSFFVVCIYCRLKLLFVLVVAEKSNMVVAEKCMVT